MNLQENNIKILEKTYGHKVYCCNHCGSHFAFDYDKNKMPAGTLRLRNANDVCHCRQYKLDAKLPKPNIEFLDYRTEKGELKTIIVITPLSKRK